jgi:hypothetical protein
MEEFRDIPGYPGLKASSFGRIIGILGEEVGCFTGSYVTCSTRNNTTQGRARLILRAFVGPPPPDKPEADHLDQNKHNDRPENLVWEDRFGQMQNRKTIQNNSVTLIRGLSLQRNLTRPGTQDRWQCKIKYKLQTYNTTFSFDKKQEAIDWLVAKRIELGI